MTVNNQNSAAWSAASLAWNSISTYTKGQIVSCDRFSNDQFNYDYIAVQDVPAGAGYRPNGGGAGTYWAVYGLQNAWKMYDLSPSSRTLLEVASGYGSQYPYVVTSGARTLTVNRLVAPYEDDPVSGFTVIPEFLLTSAGLPRSADAIALIQATCNSGRLGRVTNGTGTGTPVSTQTFSPPTATRSPQDILLSMPTGWYEGGMTGLEVKLTFDYGAGSGSVPGIGAMVIGSMFDIGDSLPGIEVGIVDYSSVNIDTYGNATITKRGYAKTSRLRVRIASSRVDEIHSMLAAMRSTPTAWIGDDAFKSTIIYGIFKSFSVDIAYPTVSYCTIEVNGIA